MEQFKQLKWSWITCEEEKNHSPRVFNFESINERDVLSRTLNEIHKCVLPKTDEYRVFKTPEEIELSKGQTNDVAQAEVKDPRKNPTRLLKASKEFVKDYGYSSELSPAEQRTIMNSSQMTTKHNPQLISESSQKQQRQKQMTLTPELIKKHKTEANHLNKCAEIYFYRNIGDLNNIVSDEMKAFLTHRWSFCQKKEEKFQVITMLLRDQEGEVDVELVESEEKNFKKEFYTITDEKFPLIERFSAEDLKFYCSLKETEQENIEDDKECGIELSFDLLIKLFVDTEEFMVKFVNISKSNGKILSSFHNPIPLKIVPIPQALDEIVKKSFQMDIDWCGMNRLKESSENFEESSNDFTEEIESFVGNSKDSMQKSETCQHKNFQDFKAELANDVMSKTFVSYKNIVGKNEINRVWKLTKGSQSFNISVHQTDAYFTPTKMPVNISIKLEYQTKFGAEKMTKAELLREWCAQLFSPGSVTFRYRIDALTLKILSILVVNHHEIENELKVSHNTNPNLLLANLINIFGCIQRLPESEFLIQTKVESECKKLYIHKTADNGKSSMDEPWEISAAFSQKWIEIDDSMPTFIHVNQQFAPGCFPSGNKKRQLSYITKGQPKKKKAAVEVKKPAVNKAKIRKATKRKNKMLKNLKAKQ